MSAVWPDTAVEENNLNQNISTLRRALGENRGENRYIATVPGQGYRFIPPVEVSGGTRTRLRACNHRCFALCESQFRFGERVLRRWNYRRDNQCYGSDQEYPGGCANFSVFVQRQTGGPANGWRNPKRRNHIRRKRAQVRRSRSHCRSTSQHRRRIPHLVRAL